MSQSVSAFLALGTNLAHEGVSGPALLAQALAAIEEAGLAVRARSSIWRTPPWPPGADQPDYHNAVIKADVAGHTPQTLLARLHSVEAAFGRERRTRWAARTLDLDIIAMEGFVGTFGAATLPHPAMHERGFVLAPLAEIAPNWRHPLLGAAATELLAALGGETGLKRVAQFP